MLKFLTSKFRNQSLNEVRPYEPQGVIRQETDQENVEKSEDEDEELRSFNLEGTPTNLIQNNNNNQEREDSTLNSKSFITNFKESPSLDQENQPPSQSDSKRNTDNVTTGFCPIDIPNTTDDCSLAAEKRKWSQVNCKGFLHQMGSGTDSSSDEEIKELCSNNKSSLLSSSPPGKVTVLSKHSSFCAQIRPTEGHTRKKHRVIICDERPSLNFEKMQQKTLLKKHSISRPRAIRIRNMSSSNVRRGFSYDQAVLVFKPIAVHPSFNLAPVEEPGFAF